MQGIVFNLSIVPTPLRVSLLLPEHVDKLSTFVRLKLQQPFPYSYEMQVTVLFLQFSNQQAFSSSLTTFSESGIVFLFCCCASDFKGDYTTFLTAKKSVVV